MDRRSMKLGTGVTIGPTTAHAKFCRPSVVPRPPSMLWKSSLLGVDIKVVIVVAFPIITRRAVLTNSPILIGVGLDLARGVLPVASRSPHDLFAEHRLVG
jgi:hypothetical protein